MTIDMQMSHEPEPCDRPFPTEGPFPLTHRHDDGRVCIAEEAGGQWQTANPVQPQVATAPTAFEEPPKPPEAVDQQEVGIYNKFNVSRVDGRDKEGGDREGAQYFVLDVVFDPAARIALSVYALVVRQIGYEKLADDLEKGMALIYADVSDAIARQNSSENPEDHIPVNLIQLMMAFTPVADRFADTDAATAAKNTRRAWERVFSSMAQIDMIPADAVQVVVVPHA